MSDDLFSIKNEFYLGNYQGAINEAQSGDIELSPGDEKERDVIVRRSPVPCPFSPQHEEVIFFTRLKWIAELPRTFSRIPCSNPPPRCIAPSPPLAPPCYRLPQSASLSPRYMHPRLVTSIS